MNRKKLPYEARATLPAHVLARKYDDAITRITNLCYLLHTDAEEIIHCRSYQKFATWAEAACVNKEG